MFFFVSVLTVSSFLFVDSSFLSDGFVGSSFLFSVNASYALFNVANASSISSCELTLLNTSLASFNAISNTDHDASV